MKIFEEFNKHPEFAQVLEVCKTLDKSGFKAWVAGGAVRDVLLRRRPKDFDVVTDAHPDVVETLFQKTLSVGKQFGIIVVVIDEVNVEVATFRSDGEYKDGRRPDGVVFATPQEDALRRDFTINALFYDPLNDKLYDFANGQEDLQKKVIKTVGDPDKRFDEDKLRLLRAVRFVAELGFDLEERTVKAVEQRSHEVPVVSSERIRDEFFKLLKGEFAARGLKLFYQLGFLHVIFPELKSAIRPDWSQRVESVFANKVENSALALALFLTVFEVPEEQSLDLCHSICTKLKVSQKLKSEVSVLLRFAYLTQAPLTEVEVKKVAGGELASLKLTLYLILKNQLGVSAQWGDKFQELVQTGYRLPEPLLSGSDLLALGLAPGPGVKKLLDEIYVLQIKEKIISKSKALEYAKSNIASIKL